MSSKFNGSKWGRISDLYAVVCRPALPMDTQQVMDLTRLIWEGEDYVPHVWEEWLSDHEGMLAVAEYSGRVVGLGKLTLLAPGQWWLEGLRVHPDFQGHGVGSHLHHYVFERWLKIGDGVIRFTTGSNRLAVHRMSARTGFNKIADVTLFKAAAMDETSAELKLVEINEIQHAVDFAMNSDSMRMTKDLMDLGWQWAKINPQNLGETVTRKHAWWWREGKGLLAIWEEDWEQETGAVIMCLACQRDQMVDLLEDFRRLAGAMGHRWAMWFAPALDDLVPVLGKAGYQRYWEDSLYIFERQHP